MGAHMNITPSLANDTIAQLRRERDRFVAFAFASADILLELDDQNHILYANGALRGLLGIESTTILNKPIMHYIAPEDQTLFASALSQLNSSSRLDSTNIRFLTPRKNKIPFALTGFSFPDMDDHKYLSMSLRQPGVNPEDILEHDIDSGFLKKKPFIEHANHYVRKANEKGEKVKVTLLDLPELKAFIDDLPQDSALELVQEISDYLRERSVDGELAGLIEEDAYSFVHHGALDIDKVTQDIIAITKKKDPSGKGMVVRTATLDADPKGLSEQDSANALLYALNRCVESQGEEAGITSIAEAYEGLLDDTVDKIKAFKDLVENDQFKVAFQPIVELKNGVVHHFELLTRFDENKYFENPFQFISFGEQANLITDFDLAMCQKTFSVLQSAAANGNYPLVSINISGKSLSSMLFMDTVKKLLELNKAFRKQVIFEITESARIKDLTVANDFIQELREEGNMCCLDDFGVAESSFDYLRKLQVDFVKIDGSYVKESIQTTEGRKMLRAMASLCRNLGIVTIGEMVEDDKTASQLWEAGVKFGQGFLFGKPTLDEDELAQCSKPTPFYRGVLRARRVVLPKSAM